MVAGGAAGIGRAIAERFAVGGYALALIDLDPIALSAVAESLQARDVPAVGWTASVADEAAIHSAVEDVVKTFCGIDVLVNNAGVSCVKPALELELAEWQRALDTPSHRATCAPNWSKGSSKKSALMPTLSSLARLHAGWGRPEEVADLALFLASEQASFITGQIIGLDGSWTAHGYTSEKQGHRDGDLQ